MTSVIPHARLRACAQAPPRRPRSPPPQRGALADRTLPWGACMMHGMFSRRASARTKVSRTNSRGPGRTHTKYAAATAFEAESGRAARARPPLPAWRPRSAPGAGAELCPKKAATDAGVGIGRRASDTGGGADRPQMSIMALADTKCTSGGVANRCMAPATCHCCGLRQTTKSRRSSANASSDTQLPRAGRKDESHKFASHNHCDADACPRRSTTTISTYVALRSLAGQLGPMRARQP